MSMRSLIGVLTASYLLVVAGCSDNTQPTGMPKLIPVTVTVTQGGTPLEGATVQLIALDSANSQWAAGGSTDAAGVANFVTLGQYQGVAPGKYKVTVSKSVSEGGPSAVAVDSPSSISTTKTFLLVDPKFQSFETTPLEIEVTEASMVLDTIDVGVPIKIEQKLG